MNFFETVSNNIKYDIWGNYQMSRQLGPSVSYGYLARKSYALAKAVIFNRTIQLNNRVYYDTWNQ